MAHRLFRSHRTGEVITPAVAAPHDTPLADAIDIRRTKQERGGRWLLGWFDCQGDIGSRDDTRQFTHWKYGKSIETDGPREYTGIRRQVFDKSRLLSNEMR